jgi:type IV pilus assembly protein PilM
MAEQLVGIWGIDIGQCALKAIRLQEIDGQVTATAFDYVEHPKILSQPDADPDQLTREALEKFLSRNTLKGDVIAISVPGQSGLARFVKLPPVEEKKIPDIVRFEAKQQIPFPLDEVVWDYQKVGSGTVTDGFAMETEIGLFALKRDMVNRYLQHFKDVNVEVHIVQMSPLALCNYVAFDLLGTNPDGEAASSDGEAGEAKKSAKPRQCIVALDIGTDNSNLVVTDGSRIIWQRPIPFGGNHFTRALTKDMKMTFAKAEHLKRNATKSPDLKKILAALKPVLNDFVGEVQRSLGYFTNTHRNAQVEYMLGLGNAFRLPGLEKFLSEKLQLDVRRLKGLQRVTGESVTGAALFSQNLMSFATAYGLALQGLSRTRLQTNLLPPEIQFERMIRAKKPWAVGAAAALLFGVLASTINYALQYRAVAAESVQQAIKAGQEVAAKAAADKAAYSKKEAELISKENSIRTIITGQQDRLNWMMLSRYVNDCLPSPGALLEGKVKSVDRKKLIVLDAAGKARDFSPDDVMVLVKGQPVADTQDLKKDAEVTVIYNDQLTTKSRQYWNHAAQEAFWELWQRQASGRSASTKAEDKGAEALIQVNVEEVQPTFTAELKHYIDRLKQNPRTQALEGMSEKDKKEPLAGPGWVVEVRGYTYQKEGKNFLLDTVVDGISTRADKDSPAAKITTADDKEKDKEALGGRAIITRVSHAVLFEYKTTHGRVVGKFSLPSVAQMLAVGGQEPAPLVFDPGGGAPTVTNSSGQVQVQAPARGASGADDEVDGERPRRRRLGANPPPPPAVTAPIIKKGPQTGPARVDFTILFAWREPAPGK